MIHSHLRMSGRWRVRDADWPIPRNAWLVIRTPEKLVAQFGGPVLELMTESRTRFDQRIAGLGPDILAAELDEEAILRRLRTDDPTRPIGDTLLDQRVLAGIGNLWKCEGCFAAGIDPWRRTGDVSDEEASRSSMRPVRGCSSPPWTACRTSSRSSTGSPGSRVRAAGSLEHPLTRAGRRQPDDILVSTMSALRRVGHKGADLIVPGNTPASFDAALAHGVDMIEFDVLPEHQHEPGKGRLLLAHDYEHVDGAPTLAGGPGPPRGLAVRRRRARRRPQAPRLRATRRGRAARARPDRAHADLLELDALADRPAPARAGPAPRLLGAAPEEGPDADVADQAARLRRRGLGADEAAVGDQGAHGRGPLRRADVLTGGSSHRAWSRPSTRPAASSTCGPSTTAGGSAGSRSSA